MKILFSSKVHRVMGDIHMLNVDISIDLSLSYKELMQILAFVLYIILMM